MISTESFPGNVNRTKGSVLIVDDNPDNLRLLARMLTEKGYKVRPAPSGSLAIKSVQSTLPDLILLDIKMPEIDGYEVCRRLKADEQTRAIPVIFISALGDMLDKIRGFGVGAVDYITKPFQHEEVLARVGTHVSLSRMYKKLQHEVMERKDAQKALKKCNYELEQRVEERTSELTAANEQLIYKIEERDLAEEALRESEERFRSLLTNIPGAIYRCVIDPLLTMHFISDVIEKISGYPASDFVQNTVRSYTSIIHPDDQEMAARTVHEGLKRKGPYIIEYRIINADGSVHWVYERGQGFFGDGGEVLWLDGAIFDITERKLAEEEQKRLISAINQAADSVVITDPEATILYVNPAFEKLTGYTQEEAIGQNPRVLKSGKHDEDFYKKMWNTLTSGKTWQGELVNKSKDGTLFTEKATISPVFDSGGKIINYIGVKHDVTTQRILEEQLTQAQKMETVGRLAGGVAHDFNNMLSVILGYADLIIGKLDPHDPIFKDLQEIKKAGQRSADITRQLLAFSRKQVIEPKIVNLNPLIAEMEKMLGRLLGEDIDLLFLPAKDLWATKADQGQINQIVANLGVNARDAMLEGGRLTIETANVTIDEAYCQGHAGFFPGRFVMLAVSDNGIGMDRETLSHIYEPFYTTKEEGKGTGLGLATVYGIIKQNNGFINVYSELGHGTIFKLYFPQCKEEEEEVTEIVVDAPKSLEFGTILLVEDEEMVRNLARMILEMVGYTVLVAKTPNEAVALCEKGDMDIHLLLTDVVMPQMSGQELKKSIEAINPEIKTLFMSGYTANVIAHHGVLDKGVNFIQKPFSNDGLARKVREVIEQ